MAGGRQAGPGPAQEGPPGQQGAALAQREAGQGEAAAVKRCQGSYRGTEQQQPQRDYAQGQDGAREAVAEAEVEERPAYEPVRAADELRDLDLDAAVVDLEPDRVADDDRDREAEQ